jgi:hypothetical protein
MSGAAAWAATGTPGSGSAPAPADDRRAPPPGLGWFQLLIPSNMLIIRADYGKFLSGTQTLPDKAVRDALLNKLCAIRGLPATKKNREAQQKAAKRMTAQHIADRINKLRAKQDS